MPAPRRVRALPLAVALGLLLAPSPGRADDQEAVRCYQEAVAHWNDADPSAAVAAGEKALAAAASKKIRLNVLLLLGRLHSAKTGDDAKAQAYYDEIIEAVSSVAPRDRPFLGLKAEALLSKGNILFAERGDLQGALQAYGQAYALAPSAANCDVLSQVELRLAHGEGVTDEARAEGLQRARKYAEEALVHDEEAGRQSPELTAKLWLQLTLVLTALGDEAGAASADKEVDPKLLGDLTRYQEAQLLALRGGEPAEVVAKLRTAFALRPTPRTRNQVRKFMRTDPLFGRLREDPDFQAVVTDEPE